VFSESYSPGPAFDRVVVTASAADIPERFIDWVKPGGRLFFVRGSSPAMEAVCLQKDPSTGWLTESLFETDLPRLVGAEDQPVFDF
jgi:protein-L-isoaspartate(D-aspartate) O-methyltransferase